MSLRGIKLVTFDATNTLLKFRVPPWQHYTVVAREHGFKGDEQQVKRRLLESFKSVEKRHPNFGRTSITWREWWRQVVKSTFEGHLPAGVDVCVIADRLIEEFKTKKCWCPAYGGDKLISVLRDRSIAIGVISNFDPRLYEILENISICRDLDFIVTSYDVGYSKPDERIFNHAIERFGNLKPSESLHIGDNIEKDYVGARAAGWHAVLIAEGVTERPPAPEHVFKSLEDLSLAIEQNKLHL